MSDPQPRRRRLAAAVVGACLLAAGTAAMPAADAASDNLGSDFWLTFPGNYYGGATQTLFITGPTATSGTVDMPGTAFSQSFTVTPGNVTSVVLPGGSDLSGVNDSVVTGKSIHVSSAAEVVVYGLNREQYTTDAYLGLPTDIQSTDYYVLGWQNSAMGSEFAVVGTADNTNVTITPGAASTSPRAAGVSYSITLQQGETYQLLDTSGGTNDLTGTHVVSDKPVSVFGGNACANIPDNQTYACDHVVEQMPPTQAWGTKFATMPLKTRTGGDTFRMLASQPNTHVSVNGSVVATLGAGEWYQTLLTGPSIITGDQPLLVAQYSNGSTFDNVTSDPFEMLIPPYEQFLNQYTVTTPASGFVTNEINLVVPDAAVGAVTVDGTAIPAGAYVPIGSGFSGTQVDVALGTHNLAGPSPFGAFMYGFDSYDSYGYPGGQTLAPIAQATSLTLAPASATHTVGTSDCSTATLLDQYAAPVVGARVDFATTGVNSTTGFANTDTNGQAQYCYTGTNAGSDTLTASVGLLSATANRMWTALGDTTPPKCTVTMRERNTVRISVEDNGSGLASITTANVLNATATIPAFTPGTKKGVLVKVQRTVIGQKSTLVLVATDMAGNQVRCNTII